MIGTSSVAEAFQVLLVEHTDPIVVRCQSPDRVLRDSTAAASPLPGGGACSGAAGWRPSIFGSFAALRLHSAPIAGCSSVPSKAPGLDCCCRRCFQCGLSLAVALSCIM